MSWNMQLLIICSMLFSLKTMIASNDETKKKRQEITKNPMYDPIFQTMFKEYPDLLLDFINSAVAKEDKLKNISDFIAPNSNVPEGSYSYDGSRILLDVLAVGDTGRHYNIKVHRGLRLFSEKCAFAEVTTVYRNQIDGIRLRNMKGQYTKYPFINKTIGIYLLNFTLPDKRGCPTILHRSATKSHNKGKVEREDALDLIYIEVPKVIQKYKTAATALKNLKTPLEAWVLYFQFADDFRDGPVPEPLRKFKGVCEALKVYNELELTPDQRLAIQRMLEVDGTHNYTVDVIEKLMEEKNRLIQEMDEEINWLNTRSRACWYCKLFYGLDEPESYDY